MEEKKPEGHPIVVMGVGGFIGGLIAGGNNAGTLWLVILSLGCSYLLLSLLGHIDKDRRDTAIGTILGLSTMVPLPCGLIGMMLGKQFWG